MIIVSQRMLLKCPLHFVQLLSCLALVLVIRMARSLLFKKCNCLV